jgi:hypothetical protein
MVLRGMVDRKGGREEGMVWYDGILFSFRGIKSKRKG